MKSSRNTFSERSLHGRIAHDLGRKIIKGHYQPGDILPNETQLCQDLDVSRTAVREAFKVLTAKGLLESRPKVGTRVRSRQEWNLLDPDILAWGLAEPVDQQFLKSLIELRNILGPESVKFTATHASDEQVKLISDNWTKFAQRQVLKQDLINADLRLQQSILSANNNPFISNLGNLITNALSDLSDPDLWNVELYNNLAENYRQLVNCIATRDSDGAQKALLKIYECQPEIGNNHDEQLENVGEPIPEY